MIVSYTKDNDFKKIKNPDPFSKVIHEVQTFKLFGEYLSSSVYEEIFEVVEKDDKKYLNRYMAIMNSKVNLFPLSKIQPGELTIELIAYIFIQLLKMTQDLAEKSHLFFYFDLVLDNVFLSYEQDAFVTSGQDQSQTDFKVCLGKIDQAFTIDPESKLLIKLN